MPVCPGGRLAAERKDTFNKPWQVCPTRAILRTTQKRPPQSPRLAVLRLCYLNARQRQTRTVAWLRISLQETHGYDDAVSGSPETTLDGNNHSSNPNPKHLAKCLAFYEQLYRVQNSSISVEYVVSLLRMQSVNGLYRSISGCAKASHSKSHLMKSITNRTRKQCDWAYLE